MTYSVSGGTLLQQGPLTMTYSYVNSVNKNGKSEIPAEMKAKPDENIENESRNKLLSNRLRLYGRAELLQFQTSLCYVYRKSQPRT